ncbi:MAG: DNA polymerase IV [Gaiellaceae bacterium]
MSSWMQPGASTMLIAHLDLDAFYAACEVLDHPEYAGRPLIVGGDPHGRGVVATASYEARRFGIHSAMSAAEALRRCPDALFVRPDFERYRARSRAVWSWVRERVERVEQTGIDEGYLELAAAHDDPGTARAVLLGLQVGLLKTTGLSASFGCGGSKTVAKIATDFRKPRGLTVVPPEQSAAFLAPLELRKLPGVGPRLEQRLRRRGLRTIGDLAALGDGELDELVSGVVGRGLRDRARGIDPRLVEPEPGEPVSQGAEETFARDLVSLAEMDDWIVRMATTVWSRLEKSGLCARRATAKVRYYDFKTVTRSQSQKDPFASLEDLTGAARALLRRALDERGDPVRLLGVYVSGLSRRTTGPGQLHLPLGG